MGKDGFHLTLSVCNGNRRAYQVALDDLEGAIGLGYLLHGRGYAVWLWDSRAACTVACSQAACCGCEREGECPEDLDVETDDEAVAEFWRRVLA